MTPINIALLVLRISILPVSACAAADAVPPPAEVQQFASGLRWKIVGPPAFAQGDAYYVQASLQSDPKRRHGNVTFLSGAVVVELWSSAGSYQTHDLYRSGTPLVHKMDGSTVFWGALSLREVFGALAPGQWTARFVLRQGRYQVDGYSESSELVAVYPFEVARISLLDVQRANTPTTDVLLKIEDKLQHSRRLATLTNRTGEAIAFTAYAHWDQGRSTWIEPLSTLNDVDRFVPGGTWQSERMGYCGTGAGSYRLEPGKTITVALFGPQGAQFIRYRLRYTFPDRATAGDRDAGFALSDAVEVTPPSAQGATPDP